MAIHSNILTWRTPWTEESGGLQSIGPHRTRHDLIATEQHKVEPESQMAVFFKKGNLDVYTDMRRGKTFLGPSTSQGEGPGAAHSPQEEPALPVL